jgi:hypothetical protein
MTIGLYNKKAREQRRKFRAITRTAMTAIRKPRDGERRRIDR